MSPILSALANTSTRGYGGLRQFAASIPTGTFISLATFDMTSNTSISSVSFTNIPDYYVRLQLRGNLRTNRADVQDAFTMRFNGDSGASSYSTHQFYGTGGSSYTSLAVDYYPTNNEIGDTNFTGLIAGGSAESGVFSPIIVDINNMNANQYKGALFYGGIVTSDISNNRTGFMTGNWRNSTNKVSSVTFACIGNTFSAGSKLSLYGIKGA
jgi:hypothetical protein